MHFALSANFTIKFNLAPSIVGMRHYSVVHCTIIYKFAVSWRIQLLPLQIAYDYLDRWIPKVSICAKNIHWFSAVSWNSITGSDALHSLIRFDWCFVRKINSSTAWLIIKCRQIKKLHLFITSCFVPGAGGLALCFIDPSYRLYRNKMLWFTPGSLFKIRNVYTPTILGGVLFVLVWLVALHRI